MPLIDGRRTPTLVEASEAMRRRILETAGPARRSGLTPTAWAALDRAESLTAWGRVNRRHVALVDGAEILASAVRHRLQAVLDGEAVEVLGLGSVSTVDGRGDGNAPNLLIDALLDTAARDGTALAITFGSGDGTWRPEERFEWVPVGVADVEVARSTRGAPMTLVRAGDASDLAALAAMGRARTRSTRFHLTRDMDVVGHGIARLGLQAGLRPPGERQVRFLVAEEGRAAAAYVVVTCTVDRWVVEDCGDRDESGARVGAILQAMIAREPAARRPAIEASFPPGFSPPQLTLTPRAPNAGGFLARRLRPGRERLDFGPDAVAYWPADRF